MTRQRDETVGSDDAFRALLDAACSDTLDDAQFDELEAAMLADENARRMYLRYFSLESDLHYLASVLRAGEADREGARGEGGGERERASFDGSAVELPNQLENLPSPFGRGAGIEGANLPSPIGRGAGIEGANLPSPFGRGAGGEGGEVDVGSQEPVPSTPYSILRTPYSSLSAFLPTTPLGSVAFSYGMSAVLVAIGLFIFSLMSASSPSNAIVGHNPANSQNSAQPNAPTPTPEPEIVSVARITGMVDCVWADPSEAPFYDKIKLHDKFALTSGLMEITYRTGARVILQGPCTYEVESAAGGFLSLGKLTARVESRSRLPDGTGRSRLPSGTLSTDHDALKSRPAGGTFFAVRTPMAVVTDLGTEFSVDVKPDKALEVCVFRGAVETARNAENGGPAIRERLNAGEAIRFAAGDTSPRRTTIDALRVTPLPSFREMALALSQSRKPSQLLLPDALTASAYHRIWDEKGKPLADNDRKLAFRAVTDGIFGRGDNKQGPLSSFDTLDADKTNTDFVGLLYNRRVRIDRIKVFMGHQFGDGGSWRSMPRVFILKNPVDPGNAPPEADPANWLQLKLPSMSYGSPYDPKPDANPGQVFEFVITSRSKQDRTGYGWAVGGVGGDGKAGYVSVTELRAYGAEVEQQKPGGTGRKTASPKPKG